MRALAAQVQSNGLDVVREGYADLLQRLDLIRSWIATETSAASKAFLADHEADLTDRWTRDILVGSDQEVARQHLAILDLTNDLGVDAAYAIVTDVDAAEDAAYRAIDTGSVLPQTGDDASDRPSHLAAILTASPLLRSGRPSAALAVVVDSLVRGEREGAQAVLDQLAADTLTTREVAAIHLKRLQSARPEITGVTEARARLERDKA
ncbi:MAG: hypothetical protein IPH03_18610 [Tetrasphaera sp.]|nr:hypothetical protein [Tetrasphaera sp.]